MPLCFETGDIKNEEKQVHISYKIYRKNECIYKL